MDTTRIGLKPRYLVIGIVGVVLFSAWPALDVIQRNLGGIALARYAYRNHCSPLSLLQCPALRPDAGVDATLESAVANNPTDSTARRNRRTRTT